MTESTLPDTVHLVDGHYMTPEKACAYIVTHADRAMVVDPTVNSAVPRLLAALADLGMAPEQVEYVAVTHAHLDHAGGAAALLAACPDATLLAHPKAARHLKDPSRLVPAARAVYGAAAFDALYGEIKGAPADRVRELADGETFDWRGRAFDVLFTTGHATHHLSLLDHGTATLFAGDAFGIGRNGAARPGPSFLLASTAPPEFDAEAAAAGVKRLRDAGPSRVAVTHFGVFDDAPKGAAQVLHSLELFGKIMRDALEQGIEDDALTAFCVERASAAVDAHLAWCGVADPEADRAWLEGDIGLNAMGLAHAVTRARRAKTGAEK